MISREAWLQALEDARRPIDNPDSDALTKVELAKLFGLERSSTHRWIILMEKRGLITRTTKYAQRSDGRYYRTPAYRLANGSKESRKR